MTKNPHLPTQKARAMADNNNGKISGFIKRAQDAILRRVIRVAKRVAGPAIRRVLAEERQLPQQATVSPTSRSGDDRMLARIAELAGSELQIQYPKLASSDAVALELARLIAPKLAALPGNP